MITIGCLVIPSLRTHLCLLAAPDGRMSSDTHSLLDPHVIHFGMACWHIPALLGCSKIVLMAHASSYSSLARRPKATAAPLLHVLYILTYIYIYIYIHICYIIYIYIYMIYVCMYLCNPHP